MGLTLSLFFGTHLGEQAAGRLMTESDKAAWLVHRAKRTNKESKALSFLLQATDLDPLNEEAQFALAGLLLKKGDFEAAEERFVETLRLEEEMLEAMLGLAQARTALGKYGAAAKVLNDALRLRPQSAPVRLSLGDAYLLGGQVREAERQYHWIKMVYPAEQEGYVGLSQLWRETGYLDHAKRVLEEGLSVAFHKEGIYREMGRLLEERSDSGGAVQSYKKALACSSMDHDSRRRMIWCYWEMGEFLSAFRAAKRLKSYDDDSDLAKLEYQLARCLQKGCPIEPVLDRATKTLENEEELLCLAQGLLRLKKYQASIRLLERAAGFDMKDPGVLFHLGKALHHVERIQHAEEALCAAMSHGYNPLDVRLELAKLHLASNEEKRVQLQLIMALQLFPKYQASHGILRVAEKSPAFHRLAMGACLKRAKMEGPEDAALNAARILSQLKDRGGRP